MSLAIAYGMKQRAKKMASGGMMEPGGMCEHGKQMCEMCHGGKMAEGGFVDEEMASGYEPMPEEKPEHMDEHSMENQEFPMEEEDMVTRIMKSRAKGYSEGGRVANDTPAMADDEDNQFDDLVKRDDLESSYTDANSGDELGNEREDEDRKDIVSRIMRMRMMKNRMRAPE